jgi:hypothetical protein
MGCEEAVFILTVAQHLCKFVHPIGALMQRRDFLKLGEFQAVVDQLRSEGGKRNPHRNNLAQWQDIGFDRHSVFADPLFIDPANHDFRLRPESSALKLGLPILKWGNGVGQRVS